MSEPPPHPAPLPSLSPGDARALSAQALQHIPACSSYEPSDQPLLILAALPFHVTSYTPPADHSEPAQLADVQHFCERFRDSTALTSQAQCYEALKVCVEDRNGLFHRQPAGHTFHPLTKAQIITELYAISVYIYYVLCRTQLLTAIQPAAVAAALSQPLTQDQLNKSELSTFVAFIQLCVHETPRSMLARPDGSMDLWRLSQLQTRSAPCGIDESLIACWCGVDFYVKWYRCAQLAQLINYETFRVTRLSSTSIFASVLSEMAEDEDDYE